MHVVEKLREQNLLGQLKLLHFHLGSQIANIRDIHTGMRECARFFSELVRLGAVVSVIDVGGGLGVDYDGTRSRSEFSVNYSWHEYALHVLQTIKDECDLAGLPHPDIITESGRAMTAHHAVLITDIIDQDQAFTCADFDTQDDRYSAEPTVLRDLRCSEQCLLENSGTRSPVEIFHSVSQSLEEAHQLFLSGHLTITQRSRTEAGVPKSLPAGTQ